MNYRHSYHAGNFADVLKHAVFALVLQHLKGKDTPFRVIDTHAGGGRYALTSPQAAKTGEWQGGIARLLGPHAKPLPSDVARHLQPYLDAVRADNVGGDAKIVAAGQLKLDGQRLLCGQRPTVLDNNLDDYGAAYPGFLILNPKLLNRVSTT